MRYIVNQWNIIYYHLAEIASLETFSEVKDPVENLHYPEQRRQSLCAFTQDMVDEPIIELINGFNRLPHCFTLQSCYGHFVYDGQEDPHNLDPLPLTDAITKVEYRIAYIALCIDNSTWGMGLFDALKEITTMDPENIQFCCADWFWKRQVNSYALQVEPDRFKHRDKAILDYKEALDIEKVRNRFFVQLYELLEIA